MLLRKTPWWQYNTTVWTLLCLTCAYLTCMTWTCCSSLKHEQEASFLCATPALFRGLPSFNPFMILGCHDGDENKKRRLLFLLGSRLTVHISHCRMTSWNEELIWVTWGFNEVSAPTTTDRKLSFASSVLAGVQTTRHDPGMNLKGSLGSCLR